MTTSWLRRLWFPLMVMTSVVCLLALRMSVRPPATQASSVDSLPIAVAVAGEISDNSRPALQAAFSPFDTIVAVFLRHADCLTCEDLGHQLRDLKRLIDPARREVLVVVTDPGFSHAVSEYLKRERLASLPIVESWIDSVLAPNQPLYTPAALVISKWKVIEGVSHTRRVRNFRDVSFALELKSLTR